MNLFKKILIAAATVLTLVLPQAATAQADTCAELREKFENAGAGAVIEGVPEYCSVEVVYTKFINFAFFAIGIVAVLAIVYGGYVYMTARGNDAQVKKGRQILTWSIIGLIIVLAAATIVNVVVSLLVDNRFV